MKLEAAYTIFSLVFQPECSLVMSSWFQSLVDSSQDSPSYWKQEILETSLENQVHFWPSFARVLISIQTFACLFKLSFWISWDSPFAMGKPTACRGKKIHTFSGQPLEKCLFSLPGLLIYTCPKAEPTGWNWKEDFFNNEQSNSVNYLDYSNTKLNLIYSYLKLWRNMYIIKRYLDWVWKLQFNIYNDWIIELEDLEGNFQVWTFLIRYLQFSWVSECYCQYGLVVNPLLENPWHTRMHVFREK